MFRRNFLKLLTLTPFATLIPKVEAKPVLDFKKVFFITVKQSRSADTPLKTPVEIVGFIAPDSLYLGDATSTAYRLDGARLILELDGDGRADTLTWNGERYVSNWLYTYGPVVLEPGGNQDCLRHDRGR